MTQKLQMFTLFGFVSTHDALAAEALLKDMGVDVVPVPAPKSLGQLCGIALRVLPEESERASDLLEAAGIEVSAVGEVMDR